MLDVLKGKSSYITAFQTLNISGYLGMILLCLVFTSLSDIFFSTALNNDGIETKEEVCATEVLDALKVRRWVISSDEQVKDGEPEFKTTASWFVPN